MGISSDFQRVVVARLRGNVPTVEDRIYDAPRETAQMPYISIGASSGFDDSVICHRMRNETLQVDVWASDKPNKSACKDAVDEIINALDGWADTEALTMSPIYIDRFAVMGDPKPGMVHGVVQVSSRIEG